MGMTVPEMTVKTDKKNSPNKMHLESLCDMVRGFTPEEVEMVCDELARKHPKAMYEALEKQHMILRSLMDSLRNLHSTYEREVNM